MQLTGVSGIGLMFDDRRFRDCQLVLGRTAAGRETGPRTCTVALKPGRYLVDDMIAGHRAAGLEATIVAE